MNIKITKSQLINILNEEDNLDFNKFNMIDAGLKALANNSDDAAVSAFGDAIIDNFSRQVDIDDRSMPDQITILPLDPGTFRVTSGFGPRNIGGGASKNHKGIDLGTRSGSPAFAVADGVVRSAKDTSHNNGCGGFVKIKHKDYTTKYCHLKEWVVKKGDKVEKGQIIGYTGGGKTDPFRGNSMGPHLHYEVVRGSTNINPTRVHSGLS